MSKSNNHASKYEIVSSGVDWITATQHLTKRKQAFRDIGETLMRADAGEHYRLTPAKRFGFIGYTGDRYFYGTRGKEVLLMVSGSRADMLFSDIVREASNISRVDVQVTVYTGSDRPNLAKHGYAHLVRDASARGRKSSVTLITKQPTGDSLLIGSRRSDCYARLYDKGVESKKAEAKTLWRYEVEFKRRLASRIATHLASDPHTATASARVIHEWYTRKGLEPFYEAVSLSQIALFRIDRTDRDILEWFRSTVSKSILRAAGRYGLPAVLESLKLDASLQEAAKEAASNA
jgi:hypothetical protein